MIAEPRYIDVFIDANPNSGEGCGLRFKSEGAPRPVTRIMYEEQPCAVVGWSSVKGGSPCPAQQIVVEDSSAGTAVLIFGADWGLRLMPENGDPPLGETHLVLAAECVLG